MIRFSNPPRSGPYPGAAALGAYLWLLLTPVLAASSQDNPVVPVPSGQRVVLEDVLVDETPGASQVETWVRFRFVAPRIARQGGDIPFPVAADDMQALCQEFAVPYLAANNLAAARVVVSLSDRQVPFGVPTPEATRYFEAYRLDGDTCIWEQF
jgi:predicted secreted protein